MSALDIINQNQSLALTNDNLRGFDAFYSKKCPPDLLELISETYTLLIGYSKDRTWDLPEFEDIEMDCLYWYADRCEEQAYLDYPNEPFWGSENEDDIQEQQDFTDQFMEYADYCGLYENFRDFIEEGLRELNLTYCNVEYSDFGNDYYYKIVNDAQLNIFEITKNGQSLMVRR